MSLFTRRHAILFFILYHRAYHAVNTNRTRGDDDKKFATNVARFKAVKNRIKNNGSALAALAPQAHLFGVGNQLLTEIWVGNVDQGFGTLPGG